MEKYTQFQDNTAGINPFLHYTPESGSNLFTADNKLSIGIFGLILIVLRLPLFIIFLSIWYIIRLFPIPRSICVSIDSIFARLVLITLGVHSYTHTKASNLQGNPEHYNPGKRTEVPVSDALVVANHHSCIDVLILLKEFSPDFAFVSNDFEEMPEKVTVHVKSGLDAFFTALNRPILPNSEGVPLSGVMKKAKKPVVLFIEGCATNGRGVIQPVTPVFADFDPEHIAGCAFNYQQKTDNTHTVESAMQFLLKMMAQLNHSISLAKLIPFNREDKQPSSPEEREELARHLRLMLTDAAKKRPLEVDCTTYRKFLSYRQNELAQNKKA